jgi:hypothetical protein
MKLVNEEKVVILCNMHVQAQKVEKCNQELKEAILAQGKLRERQGREVPITTAKVGGIVAHVKSELLEIEKGEGGDFFCRCKRLGSHTRRSFGPLLK